MASVTLTGNQVDIRFTAGESTWLGRTRLTVPLAAVRRVACAERPLRLARGARKGYVVSGFIKIGIWGVFRGPRQLVSARRGRPGLHLVLDRAITGDEFDEVVLSCEEAPQLVESIRSAIPANT